MTTTPKRVNVSDIGYENEAVVAALLKMYGNKIRLLETGLNGFKF